MSPVEKEHIIRAYTFELGKCYEQAIKERQLQCLANIDPVLCAQVATGLGLPRAGADRAARRRHAQPGPVADRRAVAGRRPHRRHRRRTPTATSTASAAVRRGGVRRRHGAAADRPARRHGRRPAGAADVRHRPVGRVRRAPARRGAGAGARRAARPRRQGRRGRRRRAWTRGCCCWSRSAGGTPRRSAPGAPARTVLAAARASPARPGVVTGESAADVVRRRQALMAAHRVWERFPATLS